MYVDNNNEELRNIYTEAVEKHNASIYSNPYKDSGFDIFVPDEFPFFKSKVSKIDFKIKCEMLHNNEPSAFYVYPRSSISKTNLRLANNVGIIDSGYRGFIQGAFDVVNTNEEYVKCCKFQRFLQICTPTLKPFKIILVENDLMLSQTERGIEGFGSTGTTGITNA
jgi:dUTP pyrophosphatase|tara:strand:- start:4481 stop:4978 length:498 start_codon:yes stop_codon:yes gene_type:complete